MRRLRVRYVYVDCLEHPTTCQKTNSSLIVRLLLTSAWCRRSQLANKADFPTPEWPDMTSGSDFSDAKSLPLSE